MKYNIEVVNNNLHAFIIGSYVNVEISSVNEVGKVFEYSVTKYSKTNTMTKMMRRLLNNFTWN